MKNIQAFTPAELIKRFKDISLTDLAQVGGKNSSLGEMVSRLSSHGIRVPDGFALTSAAYSFFLDTNTIREKLTRLMQDLDGKKFSNLHETGTKARELILRGHLPEVLEKVISSEYEHLFSGSEPAEVAVRSSATAEDLPSASFAGQHDSYLNIRGKEELLKAVRKCYASLFTDRAIKYRADNGFNHMSVALSIGIQKMVRSDLACSGVCFTLEPESGFRDVILLTGVWGLGENIVQGTVTPDEFLIFKPTLKSGKNALVSKKLGAKTKTMIYASGAEGDSGFTRNTDTPVEKREQYVLNDQEITELAR